MANITKCCGASKQGNFCVAQSWERAEPLACTVSVKTVIFLLGAVISVYIQRSSNNVCYATRDW